MARATLTPDLVARVQAMAREGWRTRHIQTQLAREGTRVSARTLQRATAGAVTTAAAPLSPAELETARARFARWELELRAKGEAAEAREDERELRDVVRGLQWIAHRRAVLGIA